MVEIKASMDTTPLQNTINRSIDRGVAGAAELVREAGTFFTRSFVKAMPKAKRKLRRKITFQDDSRHETRTTHATYIPGTGPVFGRRAGDIRPYRSIDYRGLGRLSIAAAGRSAGLPVQYSGAVGERALAKARQLGQGYYNPDENNPSITLMYSARDVTGFPGQRASKQAMTKSARAMSAWARKVQRDKTREFK